MINLTPSEFRNSNVAPGFPRTLKTCLPLVLLLFIIAPGFISAQENVITHLWSESNGVFSGKFGVPTAVDESGNLYRAGFEKQSFGGTDIKLQQVNEEGILQWSVVLNTPGTELFEPSKVFYDNGFLYVTGIVTYPSYGETDFFVSKVDDGGGVEWFVVDQALGNDVASDVFYDQSSTSIYICGTTERAGTYDVLVASYSEDGDQQWLKTFDHNGNADLGAKVYHNGSNVVIHGSSQSSASDWDIVTWFYSDAGNFISQERASGMSTNPESDELKDGAINNGFLNLTGRSFNGIDSDFKVVCLDANNNFLEVLS